MRCPLPPYFDVAIAALALRQSPHPGKATRQQTPSSPGSGALLQVPVTPLFPRGVTFLLQIKNSAAGGENLMRWTTPDGIDVPSSGR